jgi:hypothetical protein
MKKTTLKTCRKEDIVDFIASRFGNDEPRVKFYNASGQEVEPKNVRAASYKGAEVYCLK